MTGFSNAYIRSAQSTDVLFWVHAAVAYLLYRTAIPTWPAAKPTAVAVVPLVFGSLLPDLLDKPLSFVFTSVPSRSLAHSAFTVVLVLGAVGYLIHRAEEPATAVGFGVGYLSHLGADLLDSLFIPQETAVFLLWPVVTDYHHIESVGELLSLVRPTPYVFAQLLLTGLAVLVWAADGNPCFEQGQNR